MQMLRSPADQRPGVNVKPERKEMSAQLKSVIQQLQTKKNPEFS